MEATHHAHKLVELGPDRYVSGSDFIWNGFVGRPLRISTTQSALEITGSSSRASSLIAAFSGPLLPLMSSSSVLKADIKKFSIHMKRSRLYYIFGGLKSYS